MAGISLWVEPDVNWRSPRDIVRVVFNDAESIAIASAVLLYFKESPDRKEQKHYEAWQVVDNAAAAGVPTSFARNKALESLNRDGVSLGEIDVPKADLSNINLTGAYLYHADLSNTNLSFAVLRDTDLGKANLSGAILNYALLNSANFLGTNLSHADLSNGVLNSAKLIASNLKGSNLSGAYLVDTDFSNAVLNGANLKGAYFIRSNLQSAQGITQEQLAQAKLCQVALPDGIDLDPNRDCEELRENDYVAWMLEHSTEDF
ncbi:pentapeptide repeat-containing protein [Leptolyngbya sp. FACHB-16]|uniref:pentapeptide repeat-containing protein n=1 Tax=unclassified Leptolyngbya TaxID=2650499 RepID=UPI0016867689|nr:pentapeptide repeat-containing protein [Leptolyngbya sp. FACHB-16]MBD2158561.1 pentapeptide repeat-containing protein [Leptolyngbya sp. FACHB-16]